MVTGTNSSVQQPMNQMPVQSPSTPSASNALEMMPTKRASDNRRSNKPIMEKRRRARINNSLNELKALILDAMKKDPARHSKLEKADILEMTVKHLQNLQRQQAAMSAAADPSVLGKFKAGFSQCATEVGRFPGIDPHLKRRLLQHLANCLNEGSNKPQDLPQVQLHILPNTMNNMEVVTQNNAGGIILSNGTGTGVQLVPTRLPNGDIALVLPTNNSSPSTTIAVGSPHQNVQPVSNSPLPLLVPIPQRTASTGSAASTSSSSTSNYSSVHSPEPATVHSASYGASQATPLSLVVRRNEEESSVGNPWRPW